ncbi:MAG: hypothetical protein ACP5NP_04730 [Acetobacteraceae bacterium]
MSGRILYGLDRLPRTLATDDPRLLGVPDSGGLLRLNTEPLPLAVLSGMPPDHAGRVAAARAWFATLCGDYARKRERFVTACFDWAEAAIAAAHDEIAASLARYEGLFAPEDFFWSAPRPLPRAWLPGPQGHGFADIAFRTETGLVAVLLDDAPAPPGIRAVRLDASAPEAFLAASFGGFWRTERLPRGAFRRGFSPLPPAGP